MAITLSPEMEKLIESRMKDLGIVDSEAFLTAAVQSYGQTDVHDYEDLDEETRAAIEEGQAQIDAGLGRPWAEVDAELRARFVKNR